MRLLLLLLSALTITPSVLAQYRPEGGNQPVRSTASGSGTNAAQPASPNTSQASPQSKQSHYTSHSTGKTGSQTNQPARMQTQQAPNSTGKTGSQAYQPGTPKPNTQAGTSPLILPISGLSGNWQIAYKNSDGRQTNGIMNITERGDTIEGWGTDPKGTFQLAGKVLHGNRPQIVMSKQYLTPQNKVIGEPIQYRGEVDGSNKDGPSFVHIAGTWTLKDKQGLWEAALTHPARQ